MHKMQNTKLLSICIPTFNEEKNIIKILNSIFDQYSNQINIVISDNNSNDNTISLIKNYFPSYIESKDLHIFQNKRNIGQILNYKNVIFRAKTKFVWLVGADDLIAKGSIKKILSFISKKNPDILSGTLYKKSRNNLLKKIQIKEFNNINNIYKRFSSNEKVNWLIVSIWKREILLKSLNSIFLPLSISGSSYDRLVVLHALTVQKAKYKFFNESIYIKNYYIENNHRKKSIIINHIYSVLHLVYFVIKFDLKFFHLVPGWIATRINIFIYDIKRVFKKNEW